MPRSRSSTCECAKTKNASERVSIPLLPVSSRIFFQLNYRPRRNVPLPFGVSRGRRSPSSLLKKSPQVGLEPTTLRSTAACTTNCAIEAAFVQRPFTCNKQVIRVQAGVKGWRSLPSPHGDRVSLGMLSGGHTCAARCSRSGG